MTVTSFCRGTLRDAFQRKTLTTIRLKKDPDTSFTVDRNRWLSHKLHQSPNLRNTQRNNDLASPQLIGKVLDDPYKFRVTRTQKVSQSLEVKPGQLRKKH